MRSKLLNNPNRIMWIAAVLLSASWLVVYLTTVSPTVNFIDSGELITAVREPGIAHPPGYPLYVLLGYVASQLLWGEEAWRVNVLSAFWGALAVGAFFVLIFRFADYILKSRSGSVERPRTQQEIREAARQRNKRSTAAAERSTPPDRIPPDKKPQETDGAYATNRILLLLASAAAGASLLAASSTFWSRTAQAKMYSLHFFLVAVILTLALSYRDAYERKSPSAMKWLLATAATLGLSFTNHLMTVLLVLPVALLVLAGPNLGDRLTFLLRRIALALPAFLLPLLLYLYMPVRAAQAPVMNWGSTNDWGDFWRHISGWQFRPFLLGDIGGNLSRNFDLVGTYLFEQWGFLSVPVILAGLAAGVLIAVTRKWVFLPTAALLISTLIFSLFYGISEIEPYMTPFYAMLAVWLGLAPAAWLAYNERRGVARARKREMSAGVREDQFSTSWSLAALVAVAALGSMIVIYPKQNYSNNRLAEQFAMNVFDQLPQNSILITDYWDFYAPTYYLQLVKGVRRDLAIIDKSLLRYPWYTAQLRAIHPWLIGNSEDIVATFAPEQRRWVNGEPFNQNTLNQSYLDLMTSFVERNAAERPAFMLIAQTCPQGQQCEENSIAPTYARVPMGLIDMLVPQANTDVPLPEEPEYRTEGIDVNPVAFDDAALLNSSRYVDAYRRLAVLYSAAGEDDAAQRMRARAAQLESVITSR